VERLITVPSNIITLRSDLNNLTPAMTALVWEIAGALDEARIPANNTNAIWLTVPTARLRGEGSRQDNTWLKECLRRLTGMKLEGSWKNDEWGAVLLAEWHIEQNGSVARLLIPPAAIKTLNAPETFAKIEAHAAHSLNGHARRLYALLADKKRMGRPYWKFELEELRALMQLEGKTAYERFGNLNQKVLTPAIAEINDLGTVTVKMTTEKWGRSIRWVRFDWDWKDPLEASQTAAENERHSSARRKEQETNDAPPLLDDVPQGDEVREWWNGITQAERDHWADQAGRMMDGLPFLRNERDLSKAAFEKWEQAGRPNPPPSRERAAAIPAPPKGGKPQSAPSSPASGQGAD
jgi:hypothetical protein